MGSRDVKICTVHSFKGWESSFVIALLTDSAFQEVVAERIFYVALTRCRDGVFFVNNSSRVQKGLNRWDPLPKFEADDYSDFTFATPVKVMEPEL